MLFDPRKRELVEFGRKLNASITQDPVREVAVFPNGDEAFYCFSWVKQTLAEFPGEHLGYWKKNNPDAQLPFACDGHDFAIVEYRYLVDYWAKYWEEIALRTVYDLQNLEDFQLVSRLYGPRLNWR